MRACLAAPCLLALAAAAPEESALLEQLHQGTPAWTVWKRSWSRSARCSGSTAANPSWLLATRGLPTSRPGSARWEKPEGIAGLV